MRTGSTRAPDGRPVAFHDFPVDAYPIQFEVHDDELGLVWEAVMESPGVIEVPGLGPERADHRHVIVIFADGQIADSRDA